MVLVYNETLINTNDMATVSGDYIFTDNKVLERVPYVWLILSGMVFILLLPSLLFVDTHQIVDEKEENLDSTIRGVPCKSSEGVRDDYEELMPLQSYETSKPVLGKHELLKF